MTKANTELSDPVIKRMNATLKRARLGQNAGVVVIELSTDENGVIVQRYGISQVLAMGILSVANQILAEDTIREIR